MIRPVTLQDAKVIAEIYNYYILHSVATFEVDVLSEMDVKNRLKAHDPDYPWIVLEDNGVQGYAYATRWKARAAYKHSVEISVYIRNGSHGKGYGSQLYGTLLDILKAMDIHAVLGGISLPNDTSIRLHEKFGFQKVAHLKEVGFKQGAWRDVGYWELIL
jgi:phosphinothricin acetyltransferase